MEKIWYRLAGLVLLALGLLLFPVLGMDGTQAKVLAVALLMICWWISEAVPIYVTALLPMILFPLLGILPVQQTTIHYGNHVIYLFFGGFLLARGLEKWQLHRRIALSILRLTGTGPRKIVLGTLLSSAVLSMWISNTATAMMMLPIALSVVSLSLGKEGASSPSSRQGNFAPAVMLAVAYGANIGGIATLIGTPPNAVMAGIMESTFSFKVGFSNWMLLGVPFSALLLSGAYFLMVHWLLPLDKEMAGFSRELISDELNKLGKMSAAEKRVLTIFLLTAFLWVFRGQLQSLFPALSGLNDTTISILGAFLLFLIPSGAGHRSLLDWDDAKNIPWGVLLLFGGGLALAAGLESSGILEQTAAYFSSHSFEPFFLTVLLISAASVFLSELISNTAQATIMVPFAGSIAAGMGLHPLALAVPVTLAASAAFMLPMGTPPNAIVFGSGHISIRQMMKAGFWLNLLSILLIALLTSLLLPYAFGI